MRKSILTLAACFSLLTAAVSCGESQQNNQSTDAVENTHEAGNEQATTTRDDSKEMENTDVVPSGTYTGTAHIVDSEQNEVYVRLNDTTIIELYFSNDTEVLRNGEAVSFNELEEGQRLEVQVEQSGDHLNPQRVTILE